MHSYVCRSSEPSVFTGYRFGLLTVASSTDASALERKAQELAFQNIAYSLVDEDHQAGQYTSKEQGNLLPPFPSTK